MPHLSCATVCSGHHITLPVKWGTSVRVGPRIADWRSGSCLDLCDALVYIYRALGIPCGIEELPLRGNNNVPHYWIFVDDPEGQTWFSSMFYRVPVSLKAEDLCGCIWKGFPSEVRA